MSGGLNKSERLTTKKDSRCCRKVAIVESWLLVYYRLDYVHNVEADRFVYSPDSTSGSQEIETTTTTKAKETLTETIG